MSEKTGQPFMSFQQQRNFKAWFFIAGLVVALVVSLQSYLQAPKSFDGTKEYPRYNNYVIFKNSADHLLQGKNLYVLYENEHWDLYKYSPTFSVMMMPFWLLPDSVGLFLWNLLNVSVLLFALSKIEFPSFKMKLLAHLFMLPEVFTSMQNAQSNLLIAGLMILGFIYIQRNEVSKACLLILIAVFIKPFALAGFVVFIFFPGKWKMVAWSVGWSVVLFLLPLVFASWTELVWHYQNWNVMLQMDHSASYGYSVLGWLHTWFQLNPDKLMLLAAGAVLLLVPLIKQKAYSSSKFQLLMLSSVLLWVILFNHKSESPTFIIAVSGIVLWFFTEAKIQKLNLVLVVIAFVFTCLVATDVFPRSIRKEWAEPYAWKVVPCILVWLKISWDLITFKTEKD
ncbi:MAG: DUF2029 domain-containing protein [Bacteroidetes bacterium]|nr:DUF2029 domain-containing protein [Bacteroidota bacterium]